MELMRQPIFLLLTTTSSFFIIFLASIPYFGLGDDPKLVKDSALAVMLLAGLLGAVLSASNSLAREIRTGTALAVLAKPVSRAQFLLAKFLGVIGALAVMSLVNLIAALLASRMGYDAYGSTDWLALGIYATAVVLAYGLGGFSNYFLRRNFVSDGLLALVITSICAFVVINFFTQEGKLQTFGTGIDWRMVQAGLLIFFALCILAALALLCSTRLELISTLAICSAVFLLGLMSDYFYDHIKSHWWGSIPYALLPNWQVFWMADALEEGKSIPWSYLAHSLGYVVGYVGAALVLALGLFQERELG
jgi:ABC-type transport system involved in cytochrome c biogenesis permease component